jgi:hypothetical protein
MPWTPSVVLASCTNSIGKGLPGPDETVGVAEGPVTLLLPAAFVA